MRIASFLGVLVPLFSIACTYDNGDAHRVTNPDPPPCADSAPTPVQTWIDTDAQIELQPGRGAGVYVEYAAGGKWRLNTTCDAEQSSAPCIWDVIVTPEDGRSISNVVAQDLEADTDSVGPYTEYPRAINLLAETTSDVDGVSFDTEPGSAVSVDVFLDGSCALPYFFWVGDGAVHTGSPSNPLVLIPTPE
ncbi:MAG TPA: hypothetical protein VFK05_14265 [Polyangiaceae bacterium]|nr:hypothetical protein [Polyangiaceae bacterium]